MIFLNAKLDYWFVNYLVGKRELGIYVLASNVGLLLILLPNALGLVLSSYQAAKENGVAQKTAKICRITFSVSMLAAIFLVLFGRKIIIMLYGVAFEPAAAILSILIIGIIPYCLFTVFRGYYAGAGKLLIIVKATGAGLLATLALDLILIPQYGITGAAVASAISYLISAIWLINDFCKRENIPISNVLFVNKNDFSELRRTIF
jgi:O-antigen/teichoic acid export membrane protein